ncbi:MAG TPA: ectonucleotide pyrophosphatase/phosphodiesterase [Rhodanobacteraceae bacterium]|nr:ectonucleotide pyrophosphatase/phosphodiesterase [Rhodanobacteraceae bacterium]
MRISIRLFALTLGVCAIHAMAGPSRARAHAPLILVSIDGFRADYLDRGITPTLAMLARDGVRAAALRPVFPSLTFPAHYAIVTGLYPDHNGIVNNRMIDPATGKRFSYTDRTTTTDPSWWGGEPIWVSVEKHGLHSATMFWPGSGVAIEGIRPSHWRKFDGRITATQRVDQILAWLALPADRRPVFLTLYFGTVDHAGHRHGPDSVEVDAALRTVDAALGRLVSGLRRRGLYARSNLVIVSDHGMTATGPDRVIVLDRVVDTRHIYLLNSGVLAGMRAKRGRDAEVEHALLAPHAHMRCWKKSAMPARLHYGTHPRIAPLLCLADDGWTIRMQDSLERPGRRISRGQHGYDNADPNMRALFIAHGPAFRHGLVVPEFDSVDVYPLLAHLLGIPPLANDGDFDAVAGMLKTPP